jgi:hypothetical protein
MISIFIVQYTVLFSVHFHTRDNWLGGQIANTNICEILIFYT